MKKLILLAFAIAPLFSIAQSNFPYPVIFIHGLAGNWETWDEMQVQLLGLGWTFGGYLPYCLNLDQNEYVSNKLNDVGSRVPINLAVGDFYIINFDVSNCPQSNQSAIVKQGIAVKNAIKRVMDATGKDRVILFGHSMGGLAAREYLQNPDNWVSPNYYHHVAKLITTGTPHGGSNSSNLLAQAFAGIDTESEAVRDLRSSYSSSGNLGVYLFGGKEDAQSMKDGFIQYFNNVDVNCNGREGDQITGLNQKDLYTNLDFTFIIGDYTTFVPIPGFPANSDGVVEKSKADLTNYYPLCAERFIINGAHSTGLKNFLGSSSPALPDNVKTNLLALDEPDFLDIAYEVEVNRSYPAYFSTQGNDKCGVVPKNTDYDSYVFEITQPGFVQLYFTGIDEATNAEVNLYNLDQNPLQRTRASGTRIISSSILLNPGYYYVDVQADVRNDFIESYQFQVFYNRQTTGTEEAPEKIAITVFPNPVSEKLYLSNPEVIKQLRITDLAGKEIQHGTYLTDGIDVQFLASGLYILSIQLNNGDIITEKFSKI